MPKEVFHKNLGYLLSISVGYLHKIYKLWVIVEDQNKKLLRKYRQPAYRPFSTIISNSFF